MFKIVRIRQTKNAACNVVRGPVPRDAFSQSRLFHMSRFRRASRNPGVRFRSFSTYMSIERRASRSFQGPLGLNMRWPCHVRQIKVLRTLEFFVLRATIDIQVLQP